MLHKKGKKKKNFINPLPVSINSMQYVYCDSLYLLHLEKLKKAGVTCSCEMEISNKDSFFLQNCKQVKRNNKKNNKNKKCVQ